MSRLAFISDIHANLDALEPVLADIEAQKADAIICLGDVVGYGAEPAACVRHILECCVVTVMGNHEAMLSILDTIEDWELGATVREPLKFAQKQLEPAQLEALCRLPMVADMDPIAAVHASLNDPATFNYIDCAKSAERHFAAQHPWPVSFHGHTHYPCLWELDHEGDVLLHRIDEKPFPLDPDSRYAINVGSVGQPRDDDPRACYALYDLEANTVTHRRLEYNIQMARTRIARAKLPANNGLRLIKGR